MGYRDSRSGHGSDDLIVELPERARRQPIEAAAEFTRRLRMKAAHWVAFFVFVGRPGPKGLNSVTAGPAAPDPPPRVICALGRKATDDRARAGTALTLGTTLPLPLRSAPEWRTAPSQQMHAHDALGRRAVAGIEGAV